MTESYWIKVLEEVRKERILFESRCVVKDKFTREQGSYLDECEQRAIKSIAHYARRRQNCHTK